MAMSDHLTHTLPPSSTSNPFSHISSHLHKHGGIGEFNHTYNTHQNDVKTTATTSMNNHNNSSNNYYAPVRKPSSKHVNVGSEESVGSENMNIFADYDREEQEMIERAIQESLRSHQAEQQQQGLTNL